MAETVEAANMSAFQTLEYALGSQIELFETVTEEYQVLQQAVIDRDWGLLEQYMSRLQVRSRQLMELEEERTNAYGNLRRELGLSSEHTFNDVLTRVNNEQRSRLAHLYRTLKVTVMRLSGRNANLEQYVSASSETLEQILSELFPQRKGTIYGSSGHASARDSRAFVVNRNL